MHTYVGYGRRFHRLVRTHASHLLLIGVIGIIVGLVAMFMYALSTPYWRIGW